MVRMLDTADDSLAAIRARSKFGIAIAAMIRMIATTISSSISEKPFCFRISNFPLVSTDFEISANIAAVSDVASPSPKRLVTLVLGTLEMKGFVFRGEANFGDVDTGLNGHCSGKFRPATDNSCQSENLEPSNAE